MLTEITEDLLEDFVLVRTMGNIKKYYISQYEVTQELFEAVMGSNPSYFKGERNPVECISWYDAVNFCNKLSEIMGRTPCYTGSSMYMDCSFEENGFRLLTKEEWLFAAHGGLYTKKYDFSGSNILNDVAWFSGNSDKETHEVGLLKPNELDIYDMTGNVWEWVWNLTPSHGRYNFGGCFKSDAKFCQFYGYDGAPSYSDNFIGFRLGLSKL